MFFLIKKNSINNSNDIKNINKFFFHFLHFYTIELLDDCIVTNLQFLLGMPKQFLPEPCLVHFQCNGQMITKSYQPTRHFVQVTFKEGTFQPPEIKTSIDLPENVDVFGQQINLSPVRQTLSPLQDAVASISRVISGQPPLKVPIPGDRSSSWLLVTYLDDDLRVSRGDGGLFVLAKEGSPLLDQQQDTCCDELFMKRIYLPTPFPPIVHLCLNRRGKNSYIVAILYIYGGVF